ncbi:peptidoglycan D,D-transpeptidase FtsI family protein, partial [Candidatus Margulisiibacteriota bacterium]
IAEATATSLKVDSRLKERIKKLELAGIGILKERKRIYPKGRIASQVLGFVGIDNQGLAGIESRYDDYLKGRSGRLITERDVRGRDIMTSGLREIQAPSDGMNLTLTIDEPIQYVAERELRKMVRQSQAKAGIVIVMDVKSGEILALATYPDFDPNEYNKFKADILNNRAVTEVYEPGSTFKLVAVASAIQEKAITPNSHIYCPDVINIGKRTIRNSHPIKFKKGRYVKPVDVLKDSINTGAANVGIKLGKDKLYAGIKKFGFDRSSGVDLPGESRGILRHPDKWAEIDVATISFGQGIAVTPMQLIANLSSIANSGVRVKPRVVKRIEGPGKSYIKIFTPEKRGESLSPKVADAVLKMSEVVVEDGTGWHAQIDHFRIGGKTGTSQKAKPGGGYYTDSVISSFIGFAPISDPQISVLVVIDDPKTDIWGGTIAAPVFKTVTEFTLRHLNISPDNVKTSML